VLVSADSDILRGHPPAVRRMAAEALRGAGIAVIRGASAKRVGAAGVVLDNGHALEADHVLAATGPAAAEWVARSGLALTDDGFIRVDRYLRSTSHENVFAVGDCASNPERPRPKSGVFSVRAGLPLAANLRRALTGQRLLGHRPGRWSLYLLSCGRRYAIASWGPFSWSGESVWRWKDRIDRAFISRFTP
jgi:selenide,water dikinase